MTRDENAREEITLACELLRIVEKARTRELTAEQRNDLDVATATVHRVIAVALSNLSGVITVH